MPWSTTPQLSIQTPNGTDEFYPVMKVAGMFGMSRSGLLALVSKGIFPKPIKLNSRTTRWSRNELNSYVEQLKAKNK